jgi:hypothetical protein
VQVRQLVTQPFVFTIQREGESWPRESMLTSD